MKVPEYVKVKVYPNFFKRVNAYAQIMAGLFAFVVFCLSMFGIGPFFSQVEYERMTLFFISYMMLNRGRELYAKLHARGKTVSANQ